MCITVIQQRGRDALTGSRFTYTTCNVRGLAVYNRRHAKPVRPVLELAKSRRTVPYT